MGTGMPSADCIGPRTAVEALVGVKAEGAAVPMAWCPGICMLLAISLLSSPSPRLQRQWVGDCQTPALLTVESEKAG